MQNHSNNIEHFGGNKIIWLILRVSHRDSPTNQNYLSIKNSIFSKFFFQEMAWLQMGAKPFLVTCIDETHGTNISPRGLVITCNSVIISAKTAPQSLPSILPGHGAKPLLLPNRWSPKSISQEKSASIVIVRECAHP